MPYSLYTRNRLIDHVNNKTSFTMPTGVWLGLSTTTPNSTDGNVTEPSGNNYSRVSAGGSAWSAASSGSASNSSAIDFPVASGSWGTVTHLVAYDASTGGNLLWWAALSSSAAIAANQFLRLTASGTTSSLS